MTVAVGPEKPTNALRRGYYAGSDPELIGMSAMISEAPEGWYVQVTNRKHKHAFGWWHYPQADWIDDS